MRRRPPGDERKRPAEFQGAGKPGWAGHSGTLVAGPYPCASPLGRETKILSQIGCASTAAHTQVSHESTGRDQISPGWKGPCAYVGMEPRLLGAEE